MSIQHSESLVSEQLLTSKFSNGNATVSRPEIVTAFEQAIRDTYPDPLSHPYHNWSNHIPGVLNAALTLGEQLKQQGADFNRDVVISAVLGHDAGYGYNHRALGFSSKEMLAAEISEKLLLELGADPIFVAQVGNAIRATERGVEPRSIEEKILRAADLSGLAGDFRDFSENSHLLHQEFQNARGERSEYQQFFRWQVEQVLSGYLALMIQLTPGGSDDRGRSTWHQSVVRNICTSDWQAPTVGLLNSENLPQAFFASRHLLGHELILASTPVSDLGTRLEQLKAWPQRNGAPVLIVPSKQGAISLPDSCCSEVHLVLDSDLRDVREALRVAQPGATLFVYLPSEIGNLHRLLIDALSELPGVNGLNACSQLESGKVLSFEVNSSSQA